MATFPTDRSSKRKFVNNAYRGQHVARPLNAFSVYSNMHREQLRQRLPHLNNAELAKYLGELWSQMTPEHKAMYYEEARREECHCQLSETGQENVPERKKRPAKPEVDVKAVKYGGYVPPFHVYSTQIKHMQQMKSKNSLPGFKSFMLSFDKVVPTSTYMSVPFNNNHTDPGDSSLCLQNVRSDVYKANASKTTSIRDSWTQVVSQLQGYNSAENSPNQSPHIKSQSESSTPKSQQSSQQSERKKSNPRKGQKRIWMESYHNQSRQSEGVKDDDDDDDDEGQDDDSDYVYIPCEINIARTLGWPLHMLQRVSGSMLDRFKAELNISSDQDQLPLESVPLIAARNAFKPQIQATGDNASLPSLPPFANVLLPPPFDNIALKHNKTTPPFGSTGDKRVAYAINRAPYQNNRVAPWDNTSLYYSSTSGDSTPFYNAVAPCDNADQFGNNKTPATALSCSTSYLDNRVAAPGNTEVYYDYFLEDKSENSLWRKWLRQQHHDNLYNTCNSDDNLTKPQLPPEDNQAPYSKKCHCTVTSEACDINVPLTIRHNRAAQKHTLLTKR